MNDVYPVLFIIFPVAASIAVFFWFWLELLIDSFGAKHYRWTFVSFAFPPTILLYFIRHIHSHLTKTRTLALAVLLVAMAYTAFQLNPYRAVHIYP